MKLYDSLNILWHCLSLGLEWKLNFPSSVATAEFSKFAGILSAALYREYIQVKNLPAVQETQEMWAQLLGQGDPQGGENDP